MYVRYFGWQFIGRGTTLGRDNYIVEIISLKGLMGLPFLIGLIGMVHHYYRHWRHALSITGLFIMTGIAIVIYLNQEDPQPRERDYVYVASFFAFSIWIGMGLTALLEWIQEAMAGNRRLGRLLGVVVTAGFVFFAPLNLLAHNYHTHDRTGNYVAYDYSYNILQTCEPDAILFTNGDNDTFPLWFLQYVYDIRTDVRVVNLSLLNTSWYIKQLKNEQPIVPISLSDDEIDRIQIVPWDSTTLRIPVPAPVRERISTDLAQVEQLLPAAPEPLSELRVLVTPTLFGQALRVQDYMILNIIHANKWRKPIYFAVTVSDDNKVNLDPYLRMDGLGFQLVPYQGQRHISAGELESNLFDEFQFRGLDDPEVYLNTNIKGLLQNYRAAFLRLANAYMREQDHESMVRVLDRMEQVLPSETIPVPDFRLHLQIGQMYDMAGRTDEFFKRATLAFEEAPENPLAVGSLISLLSREGEHEKAIELLEAWITENPDDREAARRLEEERERLTRADSLRGRLAPGDN